MSIPGMSDQLQANNHAGSNRQNTSRLACLGTMYCLAAADKVCALKVRTACVLCANLKGQGECHGLCCLFRCHVCLRDACLSEACLCSACLCLYCAALVARAHMSQDCHCRERNCLNTCTAKASRNRMGQHWAGSSGFPVTGGCAGRGPARGVPFPGVPQAVQEDDSGLVLLGCGDGDRLLSRRACRQGGGSDQRMICDDQRLPGSFPAALTCSCMLSMPHAPNGNCKGA